MFRLNTGRKTINDLIIKRFFKKYENIYFSEFENKKFLDLWVITESITKYYGKSFFLDMNNWFIDLKKNTSINLTNNNKLKTITIDYKLWIIGIANINITNSQYPIICVL